MDALVHLVWCTTKVKWQPFVLWEIFLWPYHSNNFLQVARWKVVSFTTSAGCCMTPLGSIKVMDSNSRSRASWCEMLGDQWTLHPTNWLKTMENIKTNELRSIDSQILQNFCKQYNISLLVLVLGESVCSFPFASSLVSLFLMSSTVCVPASCASWL